MPWLNYRKGLQRTIFQGWVGACAWAEEPQLGITLLLLT